MIEKEIGFFFSFSLLFCNFAAVIAINQMKRFLVSYIVLMLTVASSTAENASDSIAKADTCVSNYYRKAFGKCGAELKTALWQILKEPSVVSYDSLWHAYQFSDARPSGDSLIIWDMYSSISAYPIDSRLHSNSKEGISGFQREHSMPKSWFNPTERNSSGYTYNDVKPMYSDVVHVIPTDGTVNNKRSNNVYAEVGDDSNVKWASAGGFSRLSNKGACVTEGWKEQVAGYSSKSVFEPNDEYKGDLARIYFYMVTCYEPICGTWTSDMFDSDSSDGYQPFAKWAFNMLMRWAHDDPVSQKEIDRNKMCYQLQGNRNPFVDFPGLEDYVWGEKKDSIFGEEAKDTAVAAAVSTVIQLNRETFGVDWTANGNMRDYYHRIPLVYSQDGIDVTFAYGIEGSKMYCDSNQVRLYNKNVLTFKSHNSKMTTIEFTVPEKSADKEFIPSVGEMDGNTWHGNDDEVTFTSTYTKSWPEANANKHIQISKAKITVAPTTGIQSIGNNDTQPKVTYNLLGRRVNESNLTMGIYIKNGKKLIIQ